MTNKHELQINESDYKARKVATNYTIPGWLNVEKVLNRPKRKGPFSRAEKEKILEIIDAGPEAYYLQYGNSKTKIPTKEIEAPPTVTTPTTEVTPVVKSSVTTSQSTTNTGQFAEVIQGIQIQSLHPDKDCQCCKGNGYVFNSDKNRVSCLCVERKKCLFYLTPLYNGVKTIPVNIDYYAGKDILLENMGLKTFKQTVKGFLLHYLYEKEIYTHCTTTPYEIVNAYYNKKEESEGVLLSDKLEKVKILFVVMNIDPPNKSYPRLLKSLIEQRKIQGLTTWIYAPEGINSNNFREQYKAEMSVYIEQNFIAPTKK